MRCQLPSLSGHNLYADFAVLIFILLQRMYLSPCRGSFVWSVCSFGDRVLAASIPCFGGNHGDTPGARDAIHRNPYNLRFGVSNCGCLLYTSPSPRDGLLSRMPSSA